MWIDVPLGRAFVPDPLNPRQLDLHHDDGYVAYFDATAKLKSAIESFGGSPIIYQLLLQRESRAFSPRLSGARVADMAYINTPFLPHYVFDSPQSLHFAQAAQFAWQSKNRRPFGLRFLREVHRRLVPDSSFAGRVRETFVWMGQRHGDISSAKVILPPPNLISRLIKVLCDFADGYDPHFRLATCAMVHFQLISIHPFFDANGRVIRATMPALLRYFGLIDEPFLFISEELLLQQWEYYERAESVQRFGETAAWIRFFVGILVAQAQRSTRFVRKVCAIRDDLRCRFATFGAPARIECVVDELLLSPTFRRSRLIELLDRSVDRSERFLAEMNGVYGLSKAVDEIDAVFQFRNIVDQLSI